MLPASRHEYILDQLRVHGHVQIDELSETLGVSAMTIHRDLDRLAAQGLLRKVRGGALAMAESPANSAECCTCRGQINGRSMVVVHMALGVHNTTGQRFSVCLTRL